MKFEVIGKDNGLTAIQFENGETRKVSDDELDKLQNPARASKAEKDTK